MARGGRGDSNVLEADRKGRFGPVYFRSDRPLVFVTAFAKALFSERRAEVTVERPCQRH